MLSTPLIHPGALSALARAGHGSRILLADANYPGTTAVHASADRVELAIAAGLPTVLEILERIQLMLPIEEATVMTPPEGRLPIHSTYAAELSPVTLDAVEREEFYALASAPSLAAIITTGDTQHFANLLLTVGAAVDSPDSGRVVSTL